METDFANEVNAIISLTATRRNHIVRILGQYSFGEYSVSYFIDMGYCHIELDKYIRGTTPSLLGILENPTALKDGRMAVVICAKFMP